MPKGKRIKNPLKFVDERENNNASRSLQPPAPTASEDTTSVEASEAPFQIPSQAAANSISSDGATRCSNSKSSSAWNVEIIEVDEEDASYGEAQGLLAGYCGILATNARIFPISFEKWSGQENGGMPKSFKDECFDTMIKELCMKNKENRSKQTIPHTCGSKSNSRRRHEMYLKTGKKPSRGMMYIETHKRKDGSFVNNEALTIVEQIELNMTQSNTQFEVSPNDAVGKVLGPEHSGRVRCMGMGAAPTNTFRNVRSRLNGMTISTNSAGSSSPTTAAILQEKINNLESDLHNSQQEVISLESKLQQSFDNVKAYLMMKEGGIPEALVGFFSAREANDAESEPTTPFDARRSVGDSNGHLRTNI
nr:uncharacterized protein LOC112777466 isoform X2 [Arachis hypogaea]